ncbi:MAG: hypothetical protein GW907_11955 [Betaproteobacteria bacterium]|nr:hypothetical protein [Betaproteobacteria bacterium]PJC21362.1 MAG: hypothetical protein CO065_03200 [Comamonadaceae bacterium CG_4_9_14_0_8_um_filter_57_21]
MASQICNTITQLCGSCEFERQDYQPTPPNQARHISLLAALRALTASLPFVVGVDAEAQPLAGAPAKPTPA